MEIKVIGNQLSQYGSSTFYKGLLFKIPTSAKTESVDIKSAIKTNDSFSEDEKKHQAESNNQKTFVIGMGDCVPVRPFHSDSLIECLAEIRMIWRDKVEQTLLLSLRLYFLPENTPKGRSGHGEDEVVAVKDAESPKGRIVIRAEDFSTWLVDDLKWNWGLLASFHEKPSAKLMSSNGIPVSSLLSNTKLDLSEVEKEKDEKLHSNVTVLSYSRYCRYRATMKRLEHIEDKQVRNTLIETLSGFVASQPNTRIMFAKETFDYPDLESHDSLCPHLAPKLKGKPLKGRQKKITSRVSDCSSPTPSSEFSVDSCETNDSDVFDGKHLIKNKDHLKNSQRLTRNKRKSESNPEVYTTLSTGRVSKQRLPLTPLKSTSTNKRKNKTEISEESSSEDDRQDEDYDGQKYVSRKLKQENSSKRQNTVKDEIDCGSQLLQALHIPLDTTKNPEELDFLMRLNSFMAERASSYPKLAELRDVNLFTIYTRVQKLGGFNAIADNRVWKNLFEDLSEPGKCINVQGMTKRRYERVLLPFERYEREMRENCINLRSELTISSIPKNSIRKESQQTQGKRRPSTSPAIEIIPLRNGAMKNDEIAMEQMEYNSSNDGLSVPVHVIVRPSANGSFDTAKRRGFDSDRMPGSSSSRSMAGGQKENIPLMLQSSTTIVPLTRDGMPANVVELIDSDDEINDKKAVGSQQSMKKRKLDILREGGLEVTPISRKAQAESLVMTYPPMPRQASIQPNVSLMSLTPVRAPPVIQSLNMFQSTSQVFKNPKEDVVNAVKNSKSYCLDLTSKKQQQDYQNYQNQQRVKNDQLSIEEVQRNYRGSNPDLQITLVKPNSESPTSSSSMNNNNINRNRQVPYKKPKNVPSSSSSSHPPPLNPVIIAAANELQKLQQQNMPSLFPFLSGIDVTPMQNQSSTPKNNQPVFDQSQALMSYLSALYGNPLLQGQNMSPAAEFLKLYNNSSAPNRIKQPSSKN